MNKTSRRAFLKNSAAASVAVAALGACKKVGAAASEAPKGPPTGGTMGPHDTGASVPVAVNTMSAR